MKYSFLPFRNYVKMSIPDTALEVLTIHIGQEVLIIYIGQEVIKAFT